MNWEFCHYLLAEPYGDKQQLSLGVEVDLWTSSVAIFD